MLRISAFVLTCFLSTSLEKAETLWVNTDKNTLVCSNEKALDDVIEVVLTKSVAEAEMAYRTPDKFGCHWHHVSALDVNKDTHTSHRINTLMGYTHFVYVRYGNHCTIDDRYLSECHVLLLRSVLLGIHDDFFNVAIGYRRLGAANQFFELFK